MQFARNFDLFGAPVGLFFSIPRRFGPPQWSHLGMFIQNVMLLAAERGLATCAQEAWAIVHKTVGEAIGLPPGRMLYLRHGARPCGRGASDQPVADGA